MMRNQLNRALFPALLFVSALWCGGCSHDAGGLTLTSMEGRQSFQQTFSKAYASRNASGDLDVVMVDDAGDAAVSGATGRKAARQIMHVRVLWLPPRDMKANNPAASNASIHWYVLCDATSNEKAKVTGSRCEMIEYQGTAWTSAKVKDDEVDLTIDNAVLKPVRNHGMQDPIGRSRLEGTITAQFNSRKVGELLADVRNSAATLTARPAAFEVPAAKTR